MNARVARTRHGSPVGQRLRSDGRLRHAPSRTMPYLNAAFVLPKDWLGTETGPPG